MAGVDVVEEKEGSFEKGFVVTHWRIPLGVSVEEHLEFP